MRFLHKHILFLVIFFLFIALFYIPNSEAYQSEEDIHLRIGFSNHTPSCYLDEDGNARGIYIDLIKHIAEEENWNIEFKPSPFGVLTDQVLKGEIDVILNMAYTEERALQFAFNSEDIYNTWAEIVVHTDSEVQTLLDLSGKKIGTVKNSIFAVGDEGIIKINERFQLGSEIVLFNTGNEMLSAVNSKQVEAAVLSRIGTPFYTLGLDLKRTGIVFSPVRVRFAVTRSRTDCDIITGKIDSHLRALKSDQTSVYFEIFDRYMTFGTPFDTELPFWIRYTMYIGGSLFVLIFVNGLYLRWKVRKKTRDLQAVNSKLLESEEQYKDLVENSNIAISLENRDAKLIYSNAQNAELFGYSIEELKTKSFADLVHPDDLDIVREHHKKRLEGKAVPKYEFRGIRGDGSVIWLEVAGVPVEKEGKIVGIRNYFWDISQRKQMEEAILQEKNFSANMISSTPAFFVAINSDGSIHLMSKSMLEALEYTEEEVVGNNYVSMFIPEDERVKVEKVFDELISKNTNTFNVNRIKTKSGKELIVEWYGRSIFNKNNEFEFFFGTGIDISEKHKLQEQLYQSQKSESIGRLAGGIAHDFNNILAVIKGAIDIINLKHGHNLGAANELIDDIDTASERASELVQQILTFSRKDETEMKPLQISLVIKEALKMLRSSIPSSIEIRQNIFDNESIVLADPIKINQIVMNLCTNASHAMQKSGGIMEVSLRKADKSEDEMPEIENSEYTLLEVRDTGHGIKPELHKQIFDPYFTTKAKGEGTGLGLAVVQGIVMDHGGNIFVSSEKGKGTSFRIYLPTYRLKSAEEKSEAKEISKGHGTILLVDDESYIVKMYNELLQTLGFNVISTESSITAYDIFMQHKDHIDLVITDQTMPKMTGTNLIREIRKERYDMKVILCTGYSESIVNDSIEFDDKTRLLLKPTSVKKLSEVVQEILTA